ncbi:DUF2330 domain-containing protein [Pseudenhygromyxa sp. WMMC2535]|uniref:DUF2330 domain-containing protein n=1 Tax=Pseudenhygromyxa sp. WMMC2535 TaxID=2712867 RepID=UPI0020D1A3E7|nr:DUF2330 domain-containing protein [Pseudenhygromyxa sp. WMMC2535]
MLSSKRSLRPALLAAALALPLLAAPTLAEAFCGFYVAGADAQLFNDATTVVLMRDGKRTVLSMQNDYQGPPEDFAMVVPVPVVLGEDDVKTLPAEIFDRVNTLASPRLVEYWEQDPCNPYVGQTKGSARSSGRGMMEPAVLSEGSSHGVTVEAQFTVGEYEIVILSAKESTGLDTWLREGGYKIPAGAEPLLRPYVESGMKFFVAKVDVDKVEFRSQPDGSKRATLSPLRVHYDSEQFALPIRLGLINAPSPAQGEGQGQTGAQDLLVHVLARGTRYQVANYPNVTIPTNLDVKDQTREHFGEFYVSLFDHTLEQQPKAVVTEYAWSAGSCDPCPKPALTAEELVTLGADVLPSYAGKLDNGYIDADLSWSVPAEFVLTRMHARYDGASLGEDLVFEAAPAIAGGREFLQAEGGLEKGAVSQGVGGQNAFQARYAIRHEWTGAIECEQPQRGIWGGPPDERDAESKPVVARRQPVGTRPGSLGSFVTASAGEQLGVAVLEGGEGARGDEGAGEAGAADTADAKGEQGEKEASVAAEAGAEAGGAKNTSEEKAEGGGCRCSADDSNLQRGVGLGLLALLSLIPVRRRRRRG